MKAAYIHIPFCEHICHYCDFNKFFIQSQPVDEYLRSLEKEMANSMEAAGHPELKTIFIGEERRHRCRKRSLSGFLIPFIAF